jgi:hypothetical protein
VLALIVFAVAAHPIRLPLVERVLRWAAAAALVGAIIVLAALAGFAIYHFASITPIPVAIIIGAIIIAYAIARRRK